VVYSGGVGSSCEGRVAVRQRDAALVVACHRLSKVRALVYITM
jgi:hypothetical protein